MNDKVAAYEKIGSLTEKMLENARNGLWEEIGALEKERQGVFSLSIASAGLSGDSDKEPEREADLIRRVLAIDGEISDLVRKEMAELHRRLDEERKILRTYAFSSEESNTP